MTRNHDRCEAGRGGLSVVVRNDDMEKALKVFKKKILTDGLMKELKARQAYEKPSERRKRKLAEANRREKKANSLRKRHSGF